MKFTELNDNNYVIFAIKHYENPHAVTKEDLRKISNDSNGLRGF